jgi:predicted RNA-binding Zn ribbon-like protein
MTVATLPVNCKHWLSSVACSSDTRVVTVEERSEAPGELDLLRRFVNTLDIETGIDELGSPSGAASWLESSGESVRVSRAELRELIVLREALRDVVSLRGDPAEQEAASRFDALARTYPVIVALSSPHALAPSSRSGVSAFVERILGIAAAARIDGSWERLKTCANDRCRWVFFDHSRNRSRTWCTMDLCGSQAKMRAYRARRRSTDLQDRPRTPK